MTSTDHAATFRQLHQHGLLLLANAWDAGSARLIESLGAKAIATTSAGVAWANGYVDGSRLPVQHSIATITTIVRVIRVPLSVDFEDGYASDPATVADNVARVIDAGAVGINIEDGADSPDLLVSKIERIKRMAAQRGVDLFVNARTDVYLRGLVSDERRIKETLARAARYRAAGADNLFVPGVADVDDIRDIVANAGLSLNVMSRPGLPSVPELTALGVRRLSAGAAISMATMDCLAGLTNSFLHGEGNPVPGKPLDYGSINKLFDGIDARQQ